MRSRNRFGRRCFRGSYFGGSRFGNDGGLGNRRRLGGFTGPPTGPRRAPASAAVTASHSVAETSPQRRPPPAPVLSARESRARSASLAWHRLKPPDKNSDVSAIFNLSRNLGGAFGVTSSPRRCMAHAVPPRAPRRARYRHGPGWGTPLASIARVVQAQAAVMSYLDIFWALGMMALVIWPDVLLLPRRPGRVAAAA